MKQIERNLIYKLIMSDDKQIENQVFTLDSKYFSTEMKEFVTDYKKTLIQGYDVGMLLRKHKQESILEEFYSTVGGVDSAIKELKREYYKFKLMESGIYDDDKILLEIIDEIKNGLLNNPSENIDRMTLTGLNDDFYDSLSKVDNALTTNLKKLDDYARLTPQNLIVICARPAVGKTAFALRLALGLSEKHTGMIFNMEMGTGEVMKRMVSQIAKIPLKAINSPRKFQVLGEKEKQSVKEAMNKLKAKGNKLEVITGSFTLDKIREMVKFKKEYGGIDYIVVDYLQLINEKKGKTRYEQVTNISLGLKAIARDLDIVVIALAQLSRESEKRADKKPMLSDLRDSGQIEQDASIVIGLHQELDPDVSTSKAKLDAIILKNRMGRLGTISHDYYLETQIIEEAGYVR